LSTTVDIARTGHPGWELPPEQWFAHLQGMTPPPAEALGIPLGELELPPTETLLVMDIPQLRLVHITQGAERLYGRPLAELCRNPALMFTAIHPEDAEPIEVYTRRLLTQPDGERVLRLCRPDGSVVWVRSHYRVTRDEQGRPRRWIYRLRELEDRELRLAPGGGDELAGGQLAIIPGFVFELDAHGKVAYANRYAAQLTGYRPHHVSDGLGLEKLFPAEDLPENREYFANLMAGREMPPREFRLRGLDGELISLFGTAVRVIRDGRPTGIRGVLVDVSDRKKAERFHRLLETTLNHTHDSVFILDDGGRVTWVNDTALVRLGYSREELLGREACEIETMLPPGGCLRVINSLRSGASTRVMQGAHRTKDGRAIPVEVVINLISFEGDEFVSVIARDISGRLQRQRDRDALLERLQRQRDAYQQLAGAEAIEHGSWDEAVRYACRVVAEALPVDRVGIWMLDQRRELLRCDNLFVRPDDLESAGMTIKFAESATYLEHLRAEHVLDAGDARRDRRLRDLRGGYVEPLGIGAILDAAIVQDGEVRGVICCEHPGKARPWNPDEVSFVTSVSSLLARVRERCARQAAERERALFKAAADRASYGALVQQMDGTIVYVNEARAAIHGMTPEELRGRNIRDLFPAERRAQVEEMLADVRRSGSFSGRESWQVRGDGTPVCLLINAVLVRGEDGQPDMIVSTSVDITELKDHQSALQEERRRLKNYIASLPGFVFRIRNAPDWPVDFISEGCLKITGWSAADLTENSKVRHIDCVHPEDQGLVWEIMHGSLERGEPYEVEYRLLHRDGGVRWVWERGYGVYGQGGELVAAEGFVFDITDRVTAEQGIRRLNIELEHRVEERTQELQKSREKYRLLVESLRDSYVFLSFSPRGEITYVSPSLAQVLGYSSEQFGEIHRAMLEQDQAYQGIQRAFHEAVAGRQPEPVEIEVHHASGERRVLEVLLVPVLEDGEVLSIEGVGHDITEHKRNLETIQQAQEQLVESEKTAALGRMVAGMAHEINTPIGIGVTAATHLQQLQGALADSFRQGRLKRSDMARFLADGEEAARMVLANLTKAAQLIQGFKGVAVDQSDEARRRFDMREYLEEILLSLKPALKKTPHQVELACPAGLEVDGRPGALSHAITNLVMNSLIHGFGDREEPGRIGIAVSAEAGEVTLRYTDDGAGMDDETRQHIYEPFFTTRREEGGSGLGMHVVYRAVTESLGGRIVCESEPGAGVVFTIVFPQWIEASDD